MIRDEQGAVKPGPAGPRLRRLRAWRRLAGRSPFHQEVNALLSVQLDPSQRSVW